MVVPKRKPGAALILANFSTPRRQRQSAALDCLHWVLRRGGGQFGAIRHGKRPGRLPGVGENLRAESSRRGWRGAVGVILLAPETLHIELKSPSGPPKPTQTAAAVEQLNGQLNWRQAARLLLKKARGVLASRPGEQVAHWRLPRITLRPGRRKVAPESR